MKDKEGQPSCGEISALSRREFLRASALGAAGICVPASTWYADVFAHGRLDTRMNVILILADDMGFSDIGCYGSEISTPNLDRLAAGGVRFSQAYNTARCCPSRASLLTGLYSHQAGIGLMVEDLGRPSYQGYLNTNCVTIAEALRESGYSTWMTGKWHVGGNQAPDNPSTWHPGAPGQPTPLDRGFDSFFGTLGGAGSYFRPPILMDQGRFIERPDEGFYYTQAIGDRACAMIRTCAAQAKPFFGYVAFTAPHWPLHALPEDIERYRDRYQKGWDALRDERYEKLRSSGLVSPKWPLSPRDLRANAWGDLDKARRDWESMRMAVYAAMVDRLDQNVGRILDSLEQTGQRDNTVVLFLSDNGACEEHHKEDGSNIKRYDLPMMNGAHARLGNIPGLIPGPESTFMSYDVAWANASNTPFRQFKKWVHEGGIATPLIINHPLLKNSAGRMVDDPCHIIDILPTVLEIAGAKHPQAFQGHDVIPLEGKSLIPLASGHGTIEQRPLCWEHMGNRALRLGPLKLVADNDAPWELYDLEADRTELHDLVDRFPDAVKAMARSYEDWANRVGAEEFNSLRKKNRSKKNRSKKK